MLKIAGTAVINADMAKFARMGNVHVLTHVNLNAKMAASFYLMIQIIVIDGFLFSDLGVHGDEFGEIFM